MVPPYRCQEVWFTLEQELGEVGARKELARLLREAADLVERDNGHIDVFGCEIPKSREFCKGEPMSTVSVTLSLPWGG